MVRLLLLCLSLLLASCEQPPTNAIRFGLATAPINLDPRFATDASSERITRLIYQQLVDFDVQARPVPALANWEKLTPQHYRFSLLGNAVFHNGQPLLAADVAATYRSILDPATASPHFGALSMIDRIDVIDTHTIDFHLNRVDMLFPGFLTIGILPALDLKENYPFHIRPMGSGAFRFIDWNEQQLILARNSDAQQFIFEQVKDPTMRVLKLLRGEIDLLQNDLPPELLTDLASRPGLHVLRAPGNNFTYIGFQLEDAVSSDPRVRRAIALAIDRQAIIKYVFNGGARLAAALLPPEHWAGHPKLKTIGYDPAAARRLLREAGYSKQRPLPLSYKTSSDPFRVRIATILQQQLAQVGISVTVQSYDWGTFFGDIKAGRFQMYSLAWVGIKSPDIFRYAFHSVSLPPDGANRGRLQNAAVDALIDQAASATTRADQARYYQDLQAYLLDLLPYVPLWYEDQYAVSSDHIQGYTLAADGAYDALMTTHRVAP
ncbi:Dipeptide-binding ABC transporter, periplasmic substrate-binding component (TC 3.A.1.5.2) [hydrothermal vent metagenome]|uniref:Dipeptide-binding ABC transporter, periplasmic substrate-binding component (TC 3.A.1.5.2) n=1 Tax=hydrothermal vent metagenome TaxID=652676 RepID=A0A3B0Z0F5_9ZZZZ